MSTTSNTSASSPPHAAPSVPWGLALLYGAVLILLGCVALSSVFNATVATVVFLGILLMVGGVVHVISAFSVRGARLWLNLLGGVLYFAVGLLMVDHPIQAAAGITMVIAVAFMLGGAFRIAISLTERFDGHMWVLLNGLITLILGVMIWRQWPESSLWVIGLFVGIDLVMAGWTYVMLALAVSGSPKQQ